MSVIAPTSAVVVDDSLAKRNALVLAVAQGLAGGNNTVIVSTGGIVGAMLAPDRGLATLTISVMVFGMWIGTVPVGILSKHYGRRFALQIGTVPIHMPNTITLIVSVASPRSGASMAPMMPPVETITVLLPPASPCATASTSALRLARLSSTTTADVGAITDMKRFPGRPF